MTIKKTLCFLCFLLMTSVLFGCEKKGTVTNQSTTYLGGKNYTLEIWVTKDASFIEALAREFASSFGERGLKTNVVSFASEKEMHEYLINDLSEGAGPDIIYTNGRWIADNTSKLIPAEITESFNIDLYKQTFVRAAYDVLIQNGDMYGVPMGVDTLAVFFNEEHLINGLKDRYEPGDTWDIFANDVDILTREDKSFERFAVSGVALGRTDNTLYTYEVFENLYTQMGGDLFSKDNTRAIFSSTSGVTADGKRRKFAIEALGFVTSFADTRHKLYTWSESMAQKTDDFKEYTPFIEGRVSMVFGYARDWTRIQAAIEKNSRVFNGQRLSKNNVRVAALPQFYDPSNSADRAVLGKVDSFAVTRGSAKPIVAWQFLTFAIGQDNLRSYFEQTNVPSPRLDLILEQESTPNIGVFVRQAKYAQNKVHPLTSDFIRAKFMESIELINERTANSTEALSALEGAFNKTIQEQIRKKAEIQKIRDEKQKQAE